MKARIGFTLLELVFVIIVMGILAKFGVELLAQAYSSYLQQRIYAELQTKSEIAVEYIAKRLEYRIKDSTIARKVKAGNFVSISDASGTDYTVLEWIGYDVEGFRGYYNGSYFKPAWSGIIDLDNSSATTLHSPDTNTTAEDNIIKALSENNSTTVDHIGLYFIGSNSDVTKDYGWDGDLTKINAQQGAIHPVKSNGTIDEFISSTGTNFTGIDVYEYYQLAWSAYGIVLENYNTTTHTGTLMIYYNYQPWLDRDGDGQGDQLTNAPFVISHTIMKNVSAFRFMAIGSIIKIQVCVKSDILNNDGGDYGICKEKTIM